jgi:molybdenum cofactor guanylyltransferase
MTSSSLPRVTGYVLIGGRGRRLGMDKAEYRIDGTPAADVLARRVESVCDGGVHLIGRSEAPWSSYPTLPDSQVGKGPLAGILTALERTATGHAVFLATDLWRVTTATLRALVQELEKTSEVTTSEVTSAGAVDVVYAQSTLHGVQPLCSVWRVESSLPVVRRHLGSADVSVFGVLDELRSKGIMVDDDELANVNEPEDLEAFLRETVAER